MIAVTPSISEDTQSLYKESLKTAPPGTTVLFQNRTRLNTSDSLFYTNALVDDKVSLQGLLDTGSMACTISEEAEQVLKEAGLASEPSCIDSNIVLIGCGGIQVKPKCIHSLKMECMDAPLLCLP